MNSTQSTPNHPNKSSPLSRSLPKPTNAFQMHPESLLSHNSRILISSHAQPSESRLNHSLSFRKILDENKIPFSDRYIDFTTKLEHVSNDFLNPYSNVHLNPRSVSREENSRRLRPHHYSTNEWMNGPDISNPNFHSTNNSDIESVLKSDTLTSSRKAKLDFRDHASPERKIERSAEERSAPLPIQPSKQSQSSITDNDNLESPTRYNRSPRGSILASLASTPLRRPLAATKHFEENITPASQLNSNRNYNKQQKFEHISNSSETIFNLKDAKSTSSSLPGENIKNPIDENLSFEFKDLEAIHSISKLANKSLLIEKSLADVYKHTAEIERKVTSSKIKANSRVLNTTLDPSQRKGHFNINESGFPSISLSMMATSSSDTQEALNSSNTSSSLDSRTDIPHNQQGNDFDNDFEKDLEDISALLPITLESDEKGHNNEQKTNQFSHSLISEMKSLQSNRRELLSRLKILRDTEEKVLKQLNENEKLTELIWSEILNYASK